MIADMYARWDCGQAFMDLVYALSTISTQLLQADLHLPCMGDCSSDCIELLC